MKFSRQLVTDKDDSAVLRDVAFNRHSMNDGTHNSPFDNDTVQVGIDGIEVRLIQGVDEESFKRVLNRSLKATTGVARDEEDDPDDWEEMMRGGLQAALESQVVVFEVSGVSRACTHQLVRSRKAAFHQQSQRATFYGNHPEARMPESVWRNPEARAAWIEAKAASDRAYQVACDNDISYQDARLVLLEATTNYIVCEYSVREFLNVYSYRACSMFNWEIVSVVRAMGLQLAMAHPFLAKYIKVSCEKSERCTFQGWERVEGQCDFPWAKEDKRVFIPADKFKIGAK